MKRSNWMMMVALVTSATLAACGGGDAGEEEMPADDMTETPAPAPAPAPTGTTGAAPEGATPEMVSMGQQIFAGKGNCMTCHGPDATGTALAPNLTDAEWINISDPSWANLQGVVRNGVPTPQQHPSPMPPMGGAQLSDQEIQAVSAYVYSLSHS